VGSAAERQLCPGAAPLQSTAGLRALPAGTEREEEGSKRELKDSLGWEERGELSWRKISTAFTRVSLWLQGMQMWFLQ